jgi:hypothetical protein
MDPSRNLCEIKNSFNSEDIKTLYQIKFYNSKKTQDINYFPRSPRALRKEIRESYNQENNEKNEHTMSLYDVNLKNEVYKLQINENIANPFFNYTFSQSFISDSFIILSNIDAVYNITNQVGGYIEPQNTKEISVGFLDDDVGFINYIRYRLPVARIFTPCIKKNKKLILNELSLNTNCDEKCLVNYILGIAPQGVDIVISRNIDFKNNLIKAMKTCKIGGTFLCRINENLYFLK